MENRMENGIEKKVGRPRKLRLTDERKTFKPFNYEWAYEYWLEHEKIHWLHSEVPMVEDYKDWKNKLTPTERYILTQIFRFFTQSDIDVAEGYVKKYLPFFPQPEIRMMLLGFGARECFDEETEVLTEHGWEKFKNVKKGIDKVAQVDTKTNTLSFAVPTDYIEKPFKGEMLHFVNDNTDIMVTPNHRMMICDNDSEQVTGFVEAKSLSRSPAGNYYETSVPNISDDRQGMTRRERLLLLVALMGRKCDDTERVVASKNGEYDILIPIKGDRKSRRLSRLLSDNNLRYIVEQRISDPTYYYQFSIPDVIKSEEDLNAVRKMEWVDITTFIGVKCVDCILELIEWGFLPDFCQEDVDINEENKSTLLSYEDVNHSLIDFIQAVCVFSGINAFITRDHEERHYNLNIDLQAFIEYPVPIKKEVDTTVYCVTMPKGTVVTRRNGKVSIQGNCVHIAAYSHLIETLGMDERTYNEFLEYEEMRNKHDYFESFVAKDEKNIAQQIAAFSAFTEGMQLFSSFVFLLNFPRHGKMKGMGQIISWSIIDESIHCEAMTKLFRTFIEENRDIWKDELKSELYRIASKMVDLEDKFIELTFRQGELENLTEQDVKQYIRYITDRRLIGLGLKGIFKVKENPLPWVNEIINLPIHGNFFENRIIEYSKGALSGSWDEVWLIEK